MWICPAFMVARKKMPSYCHLASRGRTGKPSRKLSGEVERDHS
jgi:hypothetical protein